MDSRLAPICQTFEDQKQNVQMCDSVLAQFIRSTPSDPSTFSSLAIDPHLNRFIRYVMSTITREQYPSPSEGVIPPIYLQSLQFLTILAMNHPDLLTMIAVNSPLDIIPSIFFGRNITNDRIVDPQSSHLLTPLRFLLAISASHSLNISSTSALHTLFTTLFSLFKVQPLCSLSLGIISGFSHNSPSANAFLRSLPNFASLRTEFISFLSSNDHCVVIAATSCLTGLYNVGSDASTLMKLSVHALVNPPSLPHATALSSWAIIDLVQSAVILPTYIVDIANSLLKSQGMKAMQIFTLLSELVRIGVDVVGALQYKDIIHNLIQYIITIDYDFVSVVGAHLFTQLFENDECISFGKSIAALFSQALNVVIMGNPNTSILKLESVLLILRLLLKSDESNDTIITILKSNEHSIFVGFQRAIENNQSFVALNYFLFIYQCINFIKQWGQSIVHIIAETQFSALLVFVMTHSTNRSVIYDAVFASYVISNGNLTGRDVPMSPLIDSLVSGYFVMNKRMKEEKEQLVNRYESIQVQMGKKIKEISSEKEMICSQLDEVAKEKTHSETIAHTQEQTISVAQMQIQQLEQRLKMKSSRLKDTKHELDEANKTITEQNVELQNKDQIIQEQEQKITVLKTRINGFKELERHITDVTNHRDSLEKQLSLVKANLEKTTKMNERNRELFDGEKQTKIQVENKLYETTAQLNEMTIKFHEQESMSLENEKQINRFETLLQKKTDRLNAAEETMRQLRVQVAELLDQVQSLNKTVKKQKKMIEGYHEQTTNLESSNRDQNMLYQFIHKITEKKLALYNTPPDSSE